MMMPELRFDRQMSKSHDKIALMEEKKISRLLVQAPDDSDKPKSSGGAPGSNTNADTSQEASNKMKAFNNIKT